MYAPRPPSGNLAAKQQAQPPASGGKRSKLADYDIKELTSQGSFGKVYRVVRKSDGRIFALKQVELEGMKLVEREEAIDEARMLSRIDSPYVVRYYDCFIEGTTLNILMEYASKGTLHHLIRGPGGKNAPGRPLAEPKIWKFLIQMVLGMSHIHQRKIIHRDIKALNIFLDADENIKVGDLGIARALGHDSDFARTILGTPFYLSPELCEDKPYNVKSDVWALGVCLYECCMGRHPFEAQNGAALIRKIIKGSYTPISGGYSRQLVDIVTLCLTMNPERRPDTLQLLKNPSVQAKAKELGIDITQQPRARQEGPPAEMPPPQQHQGAAPQPPQGPYPPPAAAARGAGPQQQHYAQAAPPFAAPPPAPQGGPLFPGQQPRQGNPFLEPASRRVGGAAAAAALDYEGLAGPVAVRHAQAPGARPASAAAGGQGQGYDRRGGAPGGPQGYGQQGGYQQGPPGYGQGQGQVQGQYSPNRPPQPGAPPGVIRAKQDNVGGVLGAMGKLDIATQPDNRPRPEHLPAAGMKLNLDRPGRAPWADDVDDGAGDDPAGVMTTRYERPQYGRRHNPDLMATGPSMREMPNAPIRGAYRPTSAQGGGGGGYGGGGGGGGGGYAGTVISTTTATAYPRSGM